MMRTGCCEGFCSSVRKESIVGEPVEDDPEETPSTGSMGNGNTRSRRPCVSTLWKNEHTVDGERGDYAQLKDLQDVSGIRIL